MFDVESSNVGIISVYFGYVTVHTISSNKNVIFAYGTLKKGRSNHDLLGKSHFIGKAVTVQAYGFYLGPDEQATEGSDIPYLFEHPSEGDQAIKVCGEVWEVDEFTLRQMDQLEGHPNWYQRVQASVKLDSGKEISAAIYMMPGQPRFNLQIISSGCF